jgi:hypothetical protein
MRATLLRAPAAQHAHLVALGRAHLSCVEPRAVRRSAIPRMGLSMLRRAQLARLARTAATQATRCLRRLLPRLFARRTPPGAAPGLFALPTRAHLICLLPSLGPCLVLPGRLVLCASTLATLGTRCLERHRQRVGRTGRGHLRLPFAHRILVPHSAPLSEAPWIPPRARLGRLARTAACLVTASWASPQRLAKPTRLGASQLPDVSRTLVPISLRPQTVPLTACKVYLETRGK